MRSRSPAAVRARAIHPLQWLWEPLESDRTFVLRSMFGAKAAYLDGKLMLCFCQRPEPWHGMLVCTAHEHHASLLAEFPALSVHPILPKWLYISSSSAAFDRTGEALVRRARQRDPRLGILPKPRKKRTSKTANRPR